MFIKAITQAPPPPIEFSAAHVSANKLVANMAIVVEYFCICAGADTLLLSVQCMFPLLVSNCVILQNIT